MQQEVVGLGMKVKKVITNKHNYQGLKSFYYSPKNYLCHM